MKSLRLTLVLFNLFFLIIASETLAQTTDGLVGYWSFSTGGGPTAFDTSPNGTNDGEINGATWTTGIQGGGLRL